MKIHENSDLWTKRVPLIFPYIVNNTLPRDDTLLEKLISFLKVHGESDHFGVDLCFENTFEKTLEDIWKQEDLEPTSLAAIVRIIGVIANVDDLEHYASIALLFRKSIHPDSQHVSVSYAWLAALADMVSRYQWPVIKWMYKHDFISTVVELQSNKSCFVSRVATILLANIFCNALKWKERAQNCNQADDESIVESILQILCDNCKSLKEQSDQRKTLALLHALLVKEDAYVLENLNDILSKECELKIIDILADKLADVKFQTCRQEIFSLLSVLIKFNCLVDDLKQKIGPLPRQLESQAGCFDEGIVVAAWLVERLNEKCDVTDAEEFIIEKYVTVIKSENSEQQYSSKIIYKCLLCLPYLRRKRRDAVRLLCQTLGNDSVLAGRLTENNKLHVAALHSFQNILSTDSISCPDDLTSLAQICTDLLAEHFCSHQAVTKVLQITASVLSMLIKPTEQHSSVQILLPNVLASVEEHLPLELMNLQWEIRDSALQFLAKLAAFAQGCPQMRDWLSRSSLFASVEHGLEDEERYVRASAISCLTVWLQHTATTESIVFTKLKPDDVHNALIAILREDTESFARRQVVDLYTDLYYRSSSFLHQSQQSASSTFADDILLVFCDVIEHDLDWQIKVQVLEFWMRICRTGFQSGDKVASFSDDETSKETHDGIISGCKGAEGDTNKRSVSLDDLCRFKVPQILLFALADPDNAVKSKACDLCKLILDMFDLNHEPPKAKIARGSFLPVYGQSVRDTIYTVDEFRAVLQDLDLDHIHELANKSDDQYANNPESLLQDILVALETEAQRSSVVDEPEDTAAAVDCY